METPEYEVELQFGDGPDQFPERRRDYALRACYSRYLALESTWKVVALFGLSSEDHYVPTTTRALKKELEGLASIGPDERDSNATDKIHVIIDSLETELRSIVREITLEQMRASLPQQIQSDRRSVVDLMDVMLGAEIESHADRDGRVATLDFVITTLCTDGGRSRSIQDPLTLSPRIFDLCERASEIDDPRIPELAAEFLRASDDARSINLTQTKSELGDLYFVPDVLRTIVAYNAARWDETDPGAAAPRDRAASTEDESEADINATTLFVTTALPKLGEALRRRDAGEPQTNSPFDRIAWHLDLDHITKQERADLLSPFVGRRSELAGTTMLIGLLCRSATVLAEELERIGINVDQLTGEWARELNDLLHRESARMIAANEYKSACALSELRTKHLFSAMSEVHRTRRSPHVHFDPKREFTRVREQATELASEAAISNVRPAVRKSIDEREAMRWRSLLRGGSVVLALVSVIAMSISVFVHDDGLQPLDRARLDGVSKYLESGRKSPNGRNASFVGVLEPRWSGLEPDVQRNLAAEMVEALRFRGVRQIMIYDESEALRIQALGSQPVRVIDAFGRVDPSSR